MLEVRDDVAKDFQPTSELTPKTFLESVLWLEMRKMGWLRGPFLGISSSLSTYTVVMRVQLA